MKIELNVADDRELRQSIRDLIKGEVTSIMRGEIRAVLSEVVTEKGGKNFSPEGLEKLLLDEIKAEIRRQLKPLIEGKRYGEQSFLQKAIVEITGEMLREKYSK